jgi:hypothetical protein
MCENWTGRCLLSTHVLDQRTGAEQLELMAIILLSCSFDLLLLSRQAAKCREAVELYFNRVMYTLEVKFNIFLYKRLSLSLLDAAKTIAGIMLNYYSWAAFVNTFCIDHCRFAYLFLGSKMRKSMLF